MIKNKEEEGELMADVLEFIKDGSEKFSATSIICEKLTTLLCRMQDVKGLINDEELKKTIESWRDQIHRIRLTLDELDRANK